MTYHYEHVLLFFNDPPTTELSPLSLHDALPILAPRRAHPPGGPAALRRRGSVPHLGRRRTRVAGAVAAGVVVRVLPVPGGRRLPQRDPLPQRARPFPARGGGGRSGHAHRFHATPACGHP